MNSGQKTIGILQPSYLPWLGFFEQIERSDVFVIYDDVQYSKGSWRNRNRIRTTEGWMWLSIPILTKGRSKQLIQEVEIKPSANWVSKHLKSLETYYQKAPFYQTYMPDFKALLLQKKWSQLVELNMVLIQWLCDCFEIDTQFVYSSQLNIQSSDPSERLIEICQLLEGHHFYEGASGKNYMKMDLFEKANIKVTFQNFQHPVYSQLHSPFIPYLSAIDFLMNCGPSFRNYVS